MTIHVCHATGCETPVPPVMLMCRKHWYMVPAKLQRAVWDHYRHGQEIRKDPSPEYLVAMRNAIEAVERKEGRRA